MLEVILILNLFVILCALVIRRPATFLIAANQANVVRSLTAIRDHGQPSSQYLIPSAVFSAANVQIATLALGISTLLIAATIAFKPATASRRLVLPAIPGWLRWMIGMYFVASVFSSPTIITEAYTNSGWTVFGVNLGGLTNLFEALFLYEVFRRVLGGTLKPHWGFALIPGVFFFTDFSKGATGAVSGFITTAAFFMLGLRSPPLKRVIQLGVVLGLLGMTAFVVRQIRAGLHEEGGGLALTALESATAPTSEEAANGANVTDLGIGMQYATHTLECISLYERGLRREWRSVYNPIIYTFEPSFLADALGLQRPKEAAWELAEYFIHGGGIFAIGELYWNGGYLCVFLVMGAMAAMAWACDTRYRLSLFWLCEACSFCPGMAQGFGYGLAYIERTAINGLLLYGLLRILGRIGQGAHRALQTRPTVRLVGMPQPSAQPPVPQLANRQSR